MMKDFILLCFVIIAISACNAGSSGPAPAAGSGDFSAFTLTNYPGTKAKNALRVAGDGGKLEEGTIMDGKKFGTWISYFPNQDTETIKEITSYVNGLKNGIRIIYNERGQLQKRENYKNDQFHGKTLKYKFGSKIEEEKSYKNGTLDGPSITYYQSGKKQKEINYKDGKQHGDYIYYNEEGQITLKYTYENGKKISGGMVTPGAEAAEK